MLHFRKTHTYTPMKRYLLLFCLFISFSRCVNAQIYDWDPIDSFTIRFTSDTIQNYLADTASIPLWQIGHTHKSFFTTDTTWTGIMTDTLSPYPIKANNWFVIKVPRRYRTLISFWHKYQTDSGKDGGVVEFSVNHGLTWNNISDSCNIDSNSTESSGIVTSNFYSPKDTLQTGEPSFNGVYNTSKYSRLQFLDPLAIKSTSASGCYWDIDTFYVRFRFVSDTIPDTLTGWIIDSVNVKYFEAYGLVHQIIAGNAMQTSPNPSYNGIFTFPQLKNEVHFSTEVYNATGQKVHQSPYRHSLDLSPLPRGLYFYKVADGIEYYSGRLLYE